MLVKRVWVRFDWLLVGFWWIQGGCRRRRLPLEPFWIVVYLLKMFYYIKDGNVRSDQEWGSEVTERKAVIESDAFFPVTQMLM